ncbi:hypothetical protein [Mesorhizobium sp. 2RAF21]|uniref:hypothetical protein n=1 Tax=Mesorhizobium sp. 2RAF21 TaxID=3232995 RepID=UPI003F9438F6
MAMMAAESNAISVVAVRHAKARSKFEISSLGSEEWIGGSRAGIVTEPRSFDASHLSSRPKSPAMRACVKRKSKPPKAFTLFKP